MNHVRNATLVLVAALAGCSSSATPGNGLPAGNAELDHTRYVAGPAAQKTVQTLYLANRDSPAILGFPANSEGNTKPSISISGSNTLLEEPDALAVDAHGNIYTANDGGQEIYIFPAGSNGNVTPKVLGGSNVPLTATEGIAIDRNGEIYVSDYGANQILIFAAGASGNTAPIRTISGANTGVDEPLGMAFDSANDLYVSNGYYGSRDNPPIVEFSPTANGDVKPIGTLGIPGGGGKATLDGQFSIAVNAKDDIIVGNTHTGAVDIFKHGARGNVKPDAIITGSNTGFDDITSLGIDAKGFIYVTNYAGTSPDAVLVFSPSAKGNAAPVRVLSGTKTTFSEPLCPSFF
jgi:hypothetical protein